MKKLFSTFLILAGLSAAPLSAAPIDVYGYVTEGPNVVEDDDGELVMVEETGEGGRLANFNLGDFNTDVTDPVLHFVEETWIFGWIDDCCFDGFTAAMDNLKYTLQFSVLDANPDQKKIGVSVGGVDLGNIGEGSNLLEIEVVGSTFVQLDGNNRNGNAYYLIDVVDISAVPLPASSLLLLAGVGGLAAMRRRKTA